MALETSRWAKHPPLKKDFWDKYGNITSDEMCFVYDISNVITIKYNGVILPHLSINITILMACLLSLLTHFICALCTLQQELCLNRMRSLQFRLIQGDSYSAEGGGIWGFLCGYLQWFFKKKKSFSGCRHHHCLTRIRRKDSSSYVKIILF